jgi:hypothetical protein
METTAVDPAIVGWQRGIRASFLQLLVNPQQ